MSTDPRYRELLVRIIALERALRTSGGGGGSHASSHYDGGSDELDITQLGGFPGGSTGFLREDGTFATPPGGSGGGLELLEQHTASASATLDFTNWYSSAYDEYEIHFVNILPATDNVDLIGRVSTNGGSSYDSGNNYTLTFDLLLTGFAFTTGTGTAANSLGLAGNIENTASEGGYCGVITLFNPGSTTAKKNFFGNACFQHASVGWGRTIRHWRYESTSAIDALQFSMTSGNIASGTIRIYGLTNS